MNEPGKTAMFKWRSMQALQDRNETLFYRLLVEHIEELAPIIYTPTVGEACLQYSRLFRRPRGMYFSADDRGHFNAMMYNWKSDVNVIVVTDGSRVLGLGDLGAQGMGAGAGAVTGGIGEALVATGVGLFIAIVGLIFLNHFNKRVRLGVQQMELIKITVVNRLHGGGTA